MLISEIKADDNDYEINLKTVLDAYEEKTADYGTNSINEKNDKK